MSLGWTRPLFRQFSKAALPVAAILTVGRRDNIGQSRAESVQFFSIAALQHLLERSPHSVILWASFADILCYCDKCAFVHIERLEHVGARLQATREALAIPGHWPPPRQSAVPPQDRR